MQPKAAQSHCHFRDGRYEVTRQISAEAMAEYSMKMTVQKAFRKITGAWLETKSLFDTEWYASTNPELNRPRSALFWHYRRAGWKEERDPHPLFDIKWYLKGNPDVAAAGIDPLTHYVKHGWREHRNPHPLFDVKRYLIANTDVAQAGVEPLAHYLDFGWKENRDVFVCDEDYFRRQYPKAAGFGPERLSRYLAKTQAADGVPAVRFDGKRYVEAKEKSEVRDIAPLAAYIMDCRFGTDTLVGEFDAEYYALLNPDLAHLSAENLKDHFIKTGRAEGRVAAPPRAGSVKAPITPSKPTRPDSKPIAGTPKYSQPLIISGFHRSGTSMSANLFANAGLHLGNKLLGANPSNPYGHFEDTEIVEFHDRLLKQSGTYWQTETPFLPIVKGSDWQWMLNYGIRKTVHAAWGFKDPRNCLFLPQWAGIFPDMRVLYVYRPCIQCVHSLKRRAARDLMRQRAVPINQRFWAIDDLAIRMYLIYARTALRFLESFPGESCVVSLDAMLEGRDIVREVRENWDYPLADAAVRDIYDSEVMSLSGPNELMFDRSLQSEIDEVEARFREREMLGFIPRQEMRKTEIAEEVA